jgi:hypothetical protein
MPAVANGLSAGKIFRRNTKGKGLPSKTHLLLVRSCHFLSPPNFVSAKQFQIHGVVNYTGQTKKNNFNLCVEVEHRSKEDLLWS